MTITSKSELYFHYLVQRIQSHLGKRDDQVVFIAEFCEYMGLNETEIQTHIY